MLHVIPMLARWHLFPEAYLYGFVDVLSISNPGQSSFLFGHLYPHGVPQYFPSVILIKSTLGSLGLGVLSVWLAVKRRSWLPLSALYLLTPAVVWLMGGMGFDSEYRLPACTAHSGSGLLPAGCRGSSAVDPGSKSPTDVESLSCLQLTPYPRWPRFRMRLRTQMRHSEVLQTATSC